MGIGVIWFAKDVGVELGISSVFYLPLLEAVA